MIRSQNYFSRTAGNDARMGAYYTDIDHCKSIREMFLFPENEEVSVLEPSIGDGQAVRTVTNAGNNQMIKIFGVELNGKVAESVRESNFCTEILEADFLEARIKKNAFSFCFGNPPYQNDNLTETGETERTEDQFLWKVTELLTKDGLLCWVIPYKSFVSPKAFRFLASHYELKTVYRFREKEYRKFHQVVIVAQKKERSMLLRSDVERLLSEYQEQDIPILPEHPIERFPVGGTDSGKIIPFCTRVFNPELAYEKLSGMGSDSLFDDLNKLVSRKLTVKPYVRNTAGRPPIPPKKDTLYLMATSGYGAGVAGSVETGDVHLQRGVVEMVEDVTTEQDPKNPKKQVMRVVKRAKVSMTIIENGGKITVLE